MSKRNKINTTENCTFNYSNSTLKIGTPHASLKLKTNNPAVANHVATTHRYIRETNNPLAIYL
ncbi:hypothetical protein PFUM301598_57690 [Pseudomonas fluorescens]